MCCKSEKPRVVAKEVARQYICPMNKPYGDYVLNQQVVIQMVVIQTVVIHKGPEEMWKSNLEKVMNAPVMIYCRVGDKRCLSDGIGQIIMMEP